MPLFELGFPLYGKSHTAQAQLTEQGLFPKAAGHRQILGFVFIPRLKNTPCPPLGTPQGILWSKKLWKGILITSFPQAETPSCPYYSSHNCTHPDLLQQTFHQQQRCLELQYVWNSPQKEKIGAQKYPEY